MRSAISEELHTHINDAIDMYVREGLTLTQAQKKAMEDFGDIQTITNELTITHTQRLRITQYIIGVSVIAYALATLLSFALLRIFAHSTIAAIVAPFALGLSICGIIALHLWCIHIIVGYYGLRKQKVLLFIMSWTMLMHIAITVTLDIDKFEAILHSLTVMSIIYAAYALRWKYFSLMSKKIALYIVPAGILFVALREHRLLDIFGTLKCFFITPDPVPLEGALATCHQLHLWDHVLWPMYIALIGSVYYLATFLHRFFVSRHTHLLEKIILSVTLCAAMISPVLFYDLNNTGMLDIVPWTENIYKAYDDALGRRPQEKDVAFYAMTRSYKDMDRVRDVLFASEERKIKIDLLFQEILRRHATDEEIKKYVSNRMSVADIRASLSMLPY